MSEHQPASETKPVPLHEQFAKAAIGVGGVALALAPLCYGVFTHDHTYATPAILSGSVGIGFYLFGTIVGSPGAARLKECFTRAKHIIPAAVLGVCTGAMGAYTGNMITVTEARHQADLKIATRMQPGEIISETAAEKFCMKAVKPYDQIVTVKGQKRILTCP